MLALDPLTLHALIALLFAHVLADFLFQTDWMVAHKSNPGVLALHGLIVVVTAAIALGGNITLALILGASHVAIDWVKQRLNHDNLAAYLIDQTAHITVIVLIANQVDTLGPWDNAPDQIWPAMWIVTGVMIATLAGGPAVGLLMKPYASSALPEGLPNAGRMIGLLERTLIVLMILVGEPAGIGFLIAAKSILRFNTVSESREVSEYVIIGTLASFGWALAAAYLVQIGLTLLSSA